MIGEKCFLKELLDVRLRLILIHLDLFDDHGAFTIEVILFDRGVDVHVGQHINGLLHEFVGDACIVAGAFFLRKSIEISASALNRLRDLQRGTARGSLEEHVLQKMADTGLRSRLVASTGTRPDTDRDTLSISDSRGDNRDPVFQHRNVYVFHKGLLRSDGIHCC